MWVGYPHRSLGTVVQRGRPRDLPPPIRCFYQRERPVINRAVLAALAVLAVIAPSASAETALNVVPHGQRAPGVPWAGVPGMLPADAQARMYDRLTPLFRN